MTAELGPTARALLDAAREGMSPDAAAIRRMRAAIGASVGTTAATAASTTKLTILKLSLLATVVAAVTVGTVLYVAGDYQPSATVGQHQATGQTGRPQPGQPGRPAPTGQAGQTGRQQPAQAGQAGQAGQPAQAGQTGRQQAGRPRPDLAREVELVDLAMAALRREDYAVALKAARRHASETAGKGQLAEDAAAIEIEAMCHLHESVYTKLEAFDARWPASAQRSRLTAACR